MHRFYICDAFDFSHWINHIFAFLQKGHHYYFSYYLYAHIFFVDLEVICFFCPFLLFCFLYVFEGYILPNRFPYSVDQYVKINSSWRCLDTFGVSSFQYTLRFQVLYLTFQFLVYSIYPGKYRLIAVIFPFCHLSQFFQWSLSAIWDLLVVAVSMLTLDYRVLTLFLLCARKVHIHLAKVSSFILVCLPVGVLVLLSITIHFILSPPISFSSFLP